MVVKRNKRTYLWFFAAIIVILYFISGLNETKTQQRISQRRPKISDYKSDNSESTTTKKGYDLVLSSYSPRILNYFYDLIFESSSRIRRPVVLCGHGGMSRSSVPNLWSEHLNASNVNENEVLKKITNFTLSDFIYIFIDGEGYTASDDNIILKRNTLYLGKGSPLNEKGFFFPFFITSFVERWEYSPLLLAQKGKYEPKPYFAVYIASHCVSQREAAFNLLYEFAQKNNLGEVHAVGSCYGKYPRAVFRYNNTDRETDEFECMNNLLVDSVPIYLGSSKVLKIVNNQSFFYCDSLDDFKNLLKIENFSEEKRKEMVETIKLTEEGIYKFSWHEDVAPLYQKMTGSSSTSADDILDVIVNWDKEDLISLPSFQRLKGR